MSFDKIDKLQYLIYSSSPIVNIHLHLNLKQQIVHREIEVDTIIDNILESKIIIKLSPHLRTGNKKY